MPGAYDPNKKMLTLYKNFTATGTSDTVDVSNRGLKFYSLQVKGASAAATAWTLTLEGSNDGTNWTTFFTHGTADVDGTVKQSGTAPLAAKFLRLNLSALTIGAAVSLNVYLSGVE